MRARVTLTPATDRARALREAYARRFPESQRLFEQGARYFPNRVSQYGRFHEPFPLFIETADGAELRTVDGIRLIDFWQGHFANLFGHEPAYALEAFDDAACRFQLGLNTALEQQVAAALCEATGAEQALFCTTGAQATMLATLIGLAHTGRSRVVKIEGGWHGVQPWSLVSVKRQAGDSSSPECAGLPASFAEQVIAVPFNDPQRLHDVFAQHGHEIGVVIAELVLGNAGMEMATPEFVHALRACCDAHGAVLILDEIVTGFRCRPGPLANMYGVEPDLSTFGKIVAGGLPFAAITGSREMFRSVRVDQQVRVMADAGTFTSHPGALTVALATLQQIADAGLPLYDRVERLARRMRAGLRVLLARHGLSAHVTGDSPGAGLPAFPIMTVQYRRDDTNGDGAPHQRAPVWHWDRTALDIPLRDELSRLALSLRGQFAWQGGGVVTAAHTADHIEAFLRAYDDWLTDWSSVAARVDEERNLVWS